MSNPEVTKRIMDCVSLVKDRASRAEREFDRASSAIQRQASYSIDLFGGSATSRVADIARDSRRACDDLYTAYQSLIRTLDETCRPLLSQDPDMSAVRAVRDLIKWLNDESEIENNFTASFNGRDLGDVASRRYVPSMECKMIQRYWEDKYDMWPGRAEAEAKARAAEEERRRAAAERRRAQEAEEKKKYDAEMAAYNQEHAAWEKKKAEIEIQRRQMVEETLTREMEEKKGRARKFYQEKKAELNARKAAAEADKAKAYDTLASLGFFAFGAKKENKRIIRQAMDTLEKLESEFAQLELAYKNEQRKIDTSKTKRKQDLEQAAQRRYPIPAEPKKPRKPLSTGSYGGEMTPMMMANLGIKQAILDGMEPGVLYTISDIIQNIPACADLTNQRVSAIMRGMIGDQIERVEDRRMAYFRLME